MKFYIVVFVLSFLNFSSAFDNKLSEETMFKIREGKLVKEVSRIESFLKSIEDEENKIKGLIVKEKAKEEKDIGEIPHLSEMKRVDMFNKVRMDDSFSEQDKAEEDLKRVKAEEKENEFIENLEKKLKMSKLSKENSKIEEPKAKNKIDNELYAAKLESNGSMSSSTSSTAASVEEIKKLFGMANPLYKIEGNKLKINTRLLTEPEKKVLTDLLDLFTSMKLKDFQRDQLKNYKGLSESSTVLKTPMERVDEVEIEKSQPQKRHVKDIQKPTVGKDLPKPEVKQSTTPIQKSEEKKEEERNENEIFHISNFDKKKGLSLNLPMKSDPEESKVIVRDQHPETRPQIKRNLRHISKDDEEKHRVYEKPEIRRSFEKSTTSPVTEQRSFGKPSLYEVKYRGSVVNGSNSKDGYRTVSRSSNSSGSTEEAEDLSKPSDRLYYDRNNLKSGYNSYAYSSSSSPQSLAYSGPTNGNQYASYGTSSYRDNSFNSPSNLYRSGDVYSNFNFKQTNKGNLSKALNFIDSKRGNADQIIETPGTDYSSVMAEYYSQLPVQSS